MAYGPEAGLELVEAIRDLPALAGYHLVPAVLGDLLERLGRSGEAAAEFARAASMTRNGPEQRLLLKRAAALSARRRPD
jgi:predicted RNA polymerase sigma factor